MFSISSRPTSLAHIMNLMQFDTVTSCCTKDLQSPINCSTFKTSLRFYRPVLICWKSVRFRLKKETLTFQQVFKKKFKKTGTAQVGAAQGNSTYHWQYHSYFWYLVLENIWYSDFWDFEFWNFCTFVWKILRFRDSIGTFQDCRVFVEFHQLWWAWNKQKIQKLS